MVRITAIDVKNGENVQKIECKKINLILGANNTGKSTLLKELHKVSVAYLFDSYIKWLTGVTFQIDNPLEYFESIFDKIDFNQGYELTNSQINQAGLGSLYGINYDGNAHSDFHAGLPTNITYQIANTNIQKPLHYVSKLLTSLSVAAEFCDSRISGPYDTQINQIDADIDNIVHYLFLNNNIFHKLVEQVFDTFHIELVFDNLQQGNKNIRLKPSRKPSSKDNATNKSLASYWKENSPLLHDQGDGLKAFTKISFSLFNEPKKIIFIDEPEAFLHPPQRRSLGKFIGNNLTDEKQLFIATHDSEFLRGLLTSGIDKDLVQIIYLNGDNYTKSLSVLTLSELETSAEYSENILNSFFNRKTVLCEAEDDRMIYQYFARKYFPNNSVDIQFIGENGKTEVMKIYKILKDRKVNVCCILDIDFLYSNDVLNNAIKYTVAEKAQVIACKHFLETDLEKTNIARWKINKKKFQQNGLNYFSDTLKKQKILAVIDVLETKGIFIVPVGSVETLVNLKLHERRMIQKAMNIIDSVKKRNLFNLLNKICR